MPIVQSCQLRYDCVDSAYLDCLNDNLAVLLDHLGVADVRTPFACQWYFDFDADDRAGMPILERVPVEELIRRQTGCAIQRFRFDGSPFAQACDVLVQSGRPVVIFGDAYFAPWLPYFGHEHMEHSFIVDGISDDKRLLHVVDAYYNRTEWGEALPTETYLPASALECIVQALDTPNAGSFLALVVEGRPQALDLAALLRNNAEQILAQVRDRELIRRFSRHYAARLDDVAAVKRFTLACWLVARTRALHGLWLADLARDHPGLLDAQFPELFAQDVVAPWQRVSEFAYILFRRVSQGRRAPDACFGMLEQTVHPNEVRAAQLLA